jgi:hypothetical protein
MNSLRQLFTQRFRNNIETSINERIRKAPTVALTIAATGGGFEVLAPASWELVDPGEALVREVGELDTEMLTSSKVGAMVKVSMANTFPLRVVILMVWLRVF